MFSVKQKRYISDEVQKILKSKVPSGPREDQIRGVLKSLNHPEMPKTDILFDLKISGEKDGEWQFSLHVDGAESWSWADIRNNGAVQNPEINPFNEMIAEKNPPELPIG
jgi:hypothetical protein